MLVSDDEYELPLAAASSVAELSRMTGINSAILRQALARGNRVAEWKCHVIWVDVEDE